MYYILLIHKSQFLRDIICTQTKYNNDSPDRIFLESLIIQVMFQVKNYLEMELGHFELVVVVIVAAVVALFVVEQLLDPV